MSILSHRRDWKLGLGVGGVSKAKNFKQMYEALLKFPEGAGGARKIPSVGGGMDNLCNYALFHL